MLYGAGAAHECCCVLLTRIHHVVSIVQPRKCCKRQWVHFVVGYEVRQVTWSSVGLRPLQATINCTEGETHPACKRQIVSCAGSLYSETRSGGKYSSLARDGLRGNHEQCTKLEFPKHSIPLHAQIRLFCGGFVWSLPVEKSGRRGLSSTFTLPRKRVGRCPAMLPKLLMTYTSCEYL